LARLFHFLPWIIHWIRRSILPAGCPAFQIEPHIHWGCFWNTPSQLRCSALRPNPSLERDAYLLCSCQSAFRLLWGHPRGIRFTTLCREGCEPLTGLFWEVNRSAGRVRCQPFFYDFLVFP